MALYRKYRPKTFADVVGQEHIVTTLERAVSQEKLSHAYLFSGTRGTGKTSMARILATIMLTHGTEDAVLRGQIAKGVEEGSIVDLLEIDAASHTGVDNIRELIEKIQFSPVVAHAKVYIIDEVHMLSKGAFNALLKTLEEPPPYAYFILATTELQKVPSTIQSRCQRFLFRRIREEDIIRHLQFIADQEHIVVERPALRAIAHHVEGGLRDAISLLDQLRCLPQVTLDDVKQRIGETGQEYVETILSAIEQGDREEILSIVEKMEEAAVPMEGFLRQMLSAVRSSLHQAVAERKQTDALLHILEHILHAVRDVRSAPVPGLIVESMLLSLCPSQKENRGMFFWQKKEEKSPNVKETTEKPPKEKPDAPTAAAIEAPELSVDALQGVWPTVQQEASPPSVKMSLKNGRIASLKGTTISLRFSSAFHRDKIADTEASRAIEQILERLFRRSLRLECLLEEEGKPAAATTESVNLAEAAEEVFGKEA